jgi:hypothetical protein
MSHQAKLTQAIEFADELLTEKGNNPNYFAAWRKTRADWQAMLDAGDFEAGAAQARDRFRHLFVECSDWAEAMEPYGGGPWSIQAAKFSRYMRELDAICPLVS